jgi:hypothetical protein
MDWRPMATAPRDGSEFLAMGLFGYEIARHEKKSGQFVTHMSTPEPVRDDYLVWWMPLPPPPEADPPEQFHPLTQG